MSKTTKRTQQPKLEQAEKAANKPELGHAKDGDLPEGTKKDGRVSWTPSEEQFLRDNAGRLSTFEIADKLGKTYSAVLGKAYNEKISLKTPRKTRADQIRPFAGKYSTAEIAKKLGITPKAVRASASGANISLKLPTHGWTGEQDTYLRKNASKLSQVRIGKVLGKSREAVNQRAIALGISCIKSNKWTKEEDTYIRKNAALLTAREMCRVLDRSDQAIRQRARTLDVSLAKHHRAHQQWHGYKNQKSVPLKFKNRPLPDDCN